MKAKITKGKNFKTIINYVFSPGEKNKKDRADWIGGTLGSNSPQEIIKDFDTVQRLRPHIEKPSWHCSLTLPEGEYLSDGEWEDIVEDFMEKMEFSKLTPYTIVRHNDTEFDHVHVIASRVPMTGPVWTGRNDVYKAIAATQELEKEYNLTQTPGYRKRESARETYRERKKAERTGVTPPRIQLQELIDRAVADKPTAPQLAQRLEDKGVIVRANLASTGRMNGFSFELDGLAFKGSSLGKAYSWSGLQKRGITYEPETDAAGLERYRLPVEERPPRQEDGTLPEISRSTQTVQTSLLTENEPNIATADTEETSPQTEKMLKALEGYYQSQINKNDETVESRAKEDLGNFSQPETAQKAYDLTDTDTTELSSVKEALETTLEEMEKITEALSATIDRDNRDNYTQGKSRVRAEEFSSLTAPPIEDTAQKEETEVAPEITTPEATQPPVDKCVYSKALATETSPETTQPPTDKCALSEIPQEQNQQQEWVESLVPDLAQLLVDARTHQLEGKHRTLTWDKEQQRLTLRENETQEIVLDAKWKEGRWQDNGSNLTAAFFEQIKQALDIHNSERERELQKQRSLGGFELE
ncbi:relaxase/mobilization nuclease domain-containing protein [Okeania sp. SIO1I7]|uniref:relaxase/mobilization nuclease domain-containing protein n=1 Tax=Okeania sp. SIO1I7 TaxID=2607772 RepID=UPI0013F88CB0|nr:relaxase/mobilization nuclease domain-containing protein [Okeania sp. SIO1I7]NET30128.1 relaxase/mobilization nuclease domain-containing protein [Okeania sp. SIO1I7]